MTFEAGPLEAEKSARIKIEDERQADRLRSRHRLLRPARLQGEAHHPPRPGHRRIPHHRQRSRRLRASCCKLGQRSRTTSFTRFHRDHSMRQRNRTYAAAPRRTSGTGGASRLLIREDSRPHARGLDPAHAASSTPTGSSTGDDIIFAVRVAYRGAVTFHDANQILFGTHTRLPQPALSVAARTSVGRGSRWLPTSCDASSTWSSMLVAGVGGLASTSSTCRPGSLIETYADPARSRRARPPRAAQLDYLTAALRPRPAALRQYCAAGSSRS